MQKEQKRNLLKKAVGQIRKAAERTEEHNFRRVVFIRRKEV